MLTLVFLLAQEASEGSIIIDSSDNHLYKAEGDVEVFTSLQIGKVVQKYLHCQRPLGPVVRKWVKLNPGLGETLNYKFFI